MPAGAGRLAISAARTQHEKDLVFSDRFAETGYSLVRAWVSALREGGEEQRTPEYVFGLYYGIRARDIHAMVARHAPAMFIIYANRGALNTS